YLNLNRFGNSPGFNYATLVRPQLQFQQNLQGLQTQFNTVQQSVTTLEQQTQQGLPQLPATGHLTGFMTHKIYFMNLAGAGSTGGGGTGAVGTGITGVGATPTGFGTTSKTGSGTGRRKY